MSFINYRKSKTIFKLSLNFHVYWDTLCNETHFIIMDNLKYFQALPIPILAATAWSTGPAY